MDVRDLMFFFFLYLFSQMMELTFDVVFDVFMEGFDNLVAVFDGNSVYHGFKGL